LGRSELSFFSHSGAVLTPFLEVISFPFSGHFFFRAFFVFIFPFFEFLEQRFSGGGGAILSHVWSTDVARPFLLSFFPPFLSPGTSALGFLRSCLYFPGFPSARVALSLASNESRVPLLPCPFSCTSCYFLPSPHNYRVSSRQELRDAAFFTPGFAKPMVLLFFFTWITPVPPCDSFKSFFLIGAETFKWPSFSFLRGRKSPYAYSLSSFSSAGLTAFPLFAAGISFLTESLLFTTFAS